MLNCPETCTSTFAVSAVIIIVLAATGASLARL